MFPLPRIAHLLVCGVIVAPGLSLLSAEVAAQAQDIRGTKHNLSGRSEVGGRGGSAGGEDQRSLDREVCVFCHTPTLLEGRADLAVGSGAVPGATAPRALWQSSLSPGYAFEMFDDIGRIGAEGVDPVGSVSMACLSCHDSNQAFGVSSGGVMEHPFGVPYRGIVGNRDAAEEARRRLRSDPSAPFRMATSGNLDPEGFRQVQSAVIGTRRVWWASSSPSGQRSKSDLPLYPRHNPEAPASIEEQVPFVECTSCHDPHTTREVFLRRSSAGSELCLTCHSK